jgi:hypothetical protein
LAVTTIASIVRAMKGLSIEKSDKFEALKGFLSPLNVDSDMDTDNEDGLTASDVEHQKELCAAIEQEADLSKEYEIEREILLASTIEHEEKLAKEKADQEAYVNAMKDGDDEEEMTEPTDERGGSKEGKKEDEKVMDDSSYRLNFDPGKKNKIHQVFLRDQSNVETALSKMLHFASGLSCHITKTTTV